jgi:hypothetical protein
MFPVQPTAKWTVGLSVRIRFAPEVSQANFLVAALEHPDLVEMPV